MLTVECWGEERICWAVLGVRAGGGEGWRDQDRLFIPLNNYLLLYQLQMKYYDIVYVYYTIHYTLNVQRTLEAHVQTDFISRLRFFLYKIDPFFFLTTEK